jgi:hypothetical protein
MSWLLLIMVGVVALGILLVVVVALWLTREDDDG